MIYYFNYNTAALVLFIDEKEKLGWVNQQVQCSPAVSRSADGEASAYRMTSQ